MCAAFCKRFDVVYLFHLHHASFLKTLFTVRMLLCIGCSYPVPGSAVAFPCGRISTILLILSVGKLFMLRTVSSVGQFSAAGITARMFRLSWQHKHLLQFESEDIPALLGIGNLSVRHRASFA
jgi:hypothetical protein